MNRWKSVSAKLQAKAISIVNSEVAKGAIKPAKEFMCVDCGDPAQHYDHRSYRKPLEIEPVCQKCNVARGRAIEMPPTRRTKRLSKRAGFNVSMPEYDYERLKKLADSQSRTVSNTVVWLLREYLNARPVKEIKK